MTSPRTSPAAWQQRFPQPFAPVVFGVGCVIGVAGAALAAVSDDLAGTRRGVTVGYFAVFALVMALAALYVVRPRRTGEVTLADVAIGSLTLRGVALPMRARPIALLFLGVMALYCTVGVALLVAALLGEREPLSAASIAGFLVLALLAVVMDLGVFAAVRARLWQPTAVILTPTHLVATWTHPDIAVPWEDVTTVNARSLKLGVGRELTSEDFIVVQAADRSRVAGLSERSRTRRHRSDAVMTIAVRHAAVDPVVMLDALQYYVAHPERRAELDTSAGLSRVAAGDLGVESAPGEVQAR